MNSLLAFNSKFILLCLKIMQKTGVANKTKKMKPAAKPLSTNRKKGTKKSTKTVEEKEATSAPKVDTLENTASESLLNSTSQKQETGSASKSKSYTKKTESSNSEEVVKKNVCQDDTHVPLEVESLKAGEEANTAETDQPSIADLSQHIRDEFQNLRNLLNNEKIDIDLQRALDKSQITAMRRLRSNLQKVKETAHETKKKILTVMKNK